MAPQSVSGDVQVKGQNTGGNGQGERKEVLYDGWYYDVTDFVNRHPGGIVINFYLNHGEDATSAIQQFHHRSFKRVEGIMKTFKRRPAESTPPDNSEVAKRNKALTEDFTKLYLELEKEGMFKPSYFHVAYRIFELFALAGIGFYLVSLGSTLLYVLGCVILGINGGRVAWVMHEAGHYSLTGNPKADRVLQSILLGLGVGASATWWRRHHYRHHAMPQRVKYDIDLYTMPLLAQNTKLLEDPKDGQTVFVKYQKYLFIPINAFLGGLAWLFYLTPKYALKHGLYFELFWMSIHFYLASYAPITWLYAAWVGTTYLMVNFALSHSHLPVINEPQHWVEYGLTHTVDVEHTWWCDWWMGYLNYQIEHHLFPTMPQFRQRQIAPRVKAFADKHGIPYRVLSYKEALYTTLEHYGDVADELQNMKME